MNNSAERSSWLLTLAQVLYGLWPLPVVLLSLSLISMHMKYRDAGVNMGANNGFLLFFVAPVLVVVFYAVAMVALYLANKFFKSRWPGLMLGSVLVLVLGFGAFLIESHLNSAQTLETPNDTTLFLKYYFSAIGDRLFNR